MCKFAAESPSHRRRRLRRGITTDSLLLTQLQVRHLRCERRSHWKVRSAAPEQAVRAAACHALRHDRKHSNRMVHFRLRRQQRVTDWVQRGDGVATCAVQGKLTGGLGECRTGTYSCTWWTERPDARPRAMDVALQQRWARGYMVHAPRPRGWKGGGGTGGGSEGQLRLYCAGQDRRLRAPPRRTDQWYRSLKWQ
jgi:hypothetical protein